MAEGEERQQGNTARLRFVPCKCLQLGCLGSEFGFGVYFFPFRTVIPDKWLPSAVLLLP